MWGAWGFFWGRNLLSGERRFLPQTPFSKKAALPRPPHGGWGGRGEGLSPHHAASHKRKPSRPLLKWAGRAFDMRLSSSPLFPKAALPRPPHGGWGGRGEGIPRTMQLSHKRKPSRPLLKWAGHAFDMQLSSSPLFPKAVLPCPPHGGWGGRGEGLSPHHAASHKRKPSRPLLKWAGRAFDMRLSSSGSARGTSSFS